MEMSTRSWLQVLLPAAVGTLNSTYQSRVVVPVPGVEIADAYLTSLSRRR